MVNIYLPNICMFILRKLDLCVVALCVLYTECSTKQVLMQTIDLYLILFYSRYRIIFWINLFIEFFQSTCLPIVMQFGFFPIIIECRCSYKPFEYDFFDSNIWFHVRPAWSLKLIEFNQNRVRVRWENILSSDHIRRNNISL